MAGHDQLGRRHGIKLKATLQQSVSDSLQEAIACPHCGQLVDAHAAYCVHCGVNIAIAAALEEQKFRSVRDLPPEVPLKPELIVPRLGDYLVESGHLSRDDLQRALAYQAMKRNSGQMLLIGQALRELGLVDSETLDKVVTEQILELQSALRQSNRVLEKRVRERTDALEDALQKLSELNQLKANFIANISHELRTPLTHLKGYLEMLHSGDLGELTSAQANALDVMQRAEDRLEKLIEGLIQFSLASKGELNVTKKTGPLADGLDAPISEAQKKAAARKVQFHPPSEKYVTPVYWDQEKISWVVSQLLDNAIKFTQAGGKVYLVVQILPRFVTIKVIDTGIGIPTGRIKEIFEPFHQLDSSSTRRFGGTGMGLALCQRILLAHGSQLEVRSVVGKGSQFSFAVQRAGEA